jgi:hypothetical protein
MKKSELIKQAKDSLNEEYKKEFPDKTINNLLEKIYEVGKIFEKKGNLYYNSEAQLSKDSINNQFRRFKQIKQAVLSGNLLIIGKSGCQYNVKYVRTPEHGQAQIGIIGLSFTEKKVLQGYSVKMDTGLISVSCYGTSRTLELILHIGHNLGIEDPPQSQQKL